MSADPLADAIDLRYCLGACLLGHSLGDGNGVDVIKVANILIRQLPSMGWTFARIEAPHINPPEDGSDAQQYDGDERLDG